MLIWKDKDSTQHLELLITKSQVSSLSFIFLQNWGRLHQKFRTIDYERLQMSLPQITIFYIVSRDSQTYSIIILST